MAKENETKAHVVKRFNRTLKSKMWKYFTENKTKKWIDILSDLIKNYNISIHRSIKMTPQQGSIAKNSKIAYENLLPPATTELRKPKFKIGNRVRNSKKYKDFRKPKFKIGDRVRISRKYKEFRKSYFPSFTEEIFFISEAYKTNPVTYKIRHE